MATGLQSLKSTPRGDSVTMRQTLPPISDMPSKSSKAFDLAPTFFIKITIFALLVAAIYRLHDLLLILFISILIAVTLNPFVKRLERWHLPRMAAIGLVSLSLCGGLAWIGFILLPTIYAQIGDIIANLPAFHQRLMDTIPVRSFVGNLIRQSQIEARILHMDNWANPALSLAQNAIYGLASLGITLIFSIYLLIDGRRMFIWISDFFSAPVRLKLHVTALETAPVVSTYVTAQLISSVCCGTFSYLFLSSMGVPAAFTLAGMAAFLDVLPVLGFLITLVPVTLFSLMVSPAVAGVALLVFFCYHMFEVYVLLPSIYRRALKLPGLVTLLSVLAAWSLGGLLFTLAILPIVASYPIIEKIWLPRLLGRHIVRKHRYDATNLKTSNEWINIWRDNVMRYNEVLSDDVPDRDILRSLNRTVLVVDDDADTRALIRDILETEGFSVIEASNGRDGLDILNSRENIGLVLLDYRMPGMDGLDFIEKMQTFESLRHLPVVFLSADAESLETRHAVKVIQKPVDFDQLMKLIHEHYYSRPQDPNLVPVPL